MARHRRPEHEHDVSCSFGSPTCPAYAAPRPRFGFRKRCGWCGVQLRRWQLDLCRRCRDAHNGGGSAPYPQGSRWEAEPDPWRRYRWTRVRRG